MITQEQFMKDFLEMLEIKEETITLDTDLLDIEKWSSLSAMEFIAMAENKYNIHLEPFDIAEAVLVEDLYYVVENCNK